KVRVDEPGDSDFLPGSLIDKFRFRKVNDQLLKEKKRPATAEPVLLGITKASLQSEPLISAASFQETTKLLTEAAIAGKRADLLGMKQTVILGHVLPPGRGLKAYHMPKVKKNAPEPQPERPAVVDEQAAQSASLRGVFEATPDTTAG